MLASIGSSTEERAGGQSDEQNFRVERKHLGSADLKLGEELKCSPGHRCSDQHPFRSCKWPSNLCLNPSSIGASPQWLDPGDPPVSDPIFPLDRNPASSEISFTGPPASTPLGTKRAGCCLSSMASPRFLQPRGPLLHNRGSFLRSTALFPGQPAFSPLK